MHLLSRKDQNSAELDTVRVSRNPTTVITAYGEVQTNEEATVYVHDLELLRIARNAKLDAKHSLLEYVLTAEV